MNPEHPTRLALRAAIKAEYERTKVDITTMRPADERDDVNIQVAQNVVRVVLESLLTEMMPTSYSLIVDLAMRSASYAFSVVRLEDQELLVAALINNFAEFHQLRTAHGVVIAAEWEDKDGKMVRNHG